MIDKLSILIPVYNDDASLLVNSLVREAQKVKGLEYEVVVYDDGSTDSRCIEANKRLSQLSGCRYVAEPHHTCRAAMRNAMLRQGKYEWCLMVDVRLQLVSNNFISNYVYTDVSGCGAVCGGVVVKGATVSRNSILRVCVSDTRSMRSAIMIWSRVDAVPISRFVLQILCFVALCCSKCPTTSASLAMVMRMSCLARVLKRQALRCST